jgi:hypothetical protein
MLDFVTFTINEESAIYNIYNINNPTYESTIIEQNTVGNLESINKISISFVIPHSYDLIDNIYIINKDFDSIIHNIEFLIGGCIILELCPEIIELCKLYDKNNDKNNDKNLINLHINKFLQYIPLISLQFYEVRVNIIYKSIDITKLPQLYFSGIHLDNQQRQQFKNFNDEIIIYRPRILNFSNKIEKKLNIDLDDSIIDIFLIPQNTELLIKNSIIKLNNKLYSNQNYQSHKFVKMNEIYLPKNWINCNFSETNLFPKKSFQAIKLKKISFSLEGENLNGDWKVLEITVNKLKIPIQNVY